MPRFSKTESVCVVKQVNVDIPITQIAVQERSQV